MTRFTVLFAIATQVEASTPEAAALELAARADLRGTELGGFVWYENPAIVNVQDFDSDESWSVQIDRDDPDAANVISQDAREFTAMVRGADPILDDYDDDEWWRNEFAAWKREGMPGVVASWGDELTDDQLFDMFRTIRSIVDPDPGELPASPGKGELE